MLTRTTRTEAAAYALSLIGRSRDALPVPWTASLVMDDCAAFCSHVLWGGKPGPILWVDNFKSAGDGSYAGGSTDLQPWDVLLFDWEGNGVGNHVEFMVADLGNGTVRTYGANGSDTRKAAYRIRPKRYIMGRFRPAWTTAAPPAPRPSTPASSTPAPSDLGEHDMILFEHKKRGQALGGAGFFHPLTPEEAPWAGDLASKHIVCVNERHFDLIVAMCTQGDAATGVGPRVWNHMITAPENGTQPAHARLSGADLGRNVSTSVLASIAAAVAAIVGVKR